MSKIVKREELAKRLNLEEQLEREDTIDLVLPAEEGSVISQDTYQASAAARRVMESAKAEAHRIKKEAEDILKRVQERMEESKKRGFEEGCEQGRAEISEMLIAAIAAKEKMFDGVEHDLVKMVYEISEKILGAELVERRSAVVDLIKQTLHAAIGQKIVILVNPKDLAVVKENQPALVQAIDTSKTIQIRADEKVAPHGCFIETEVGTIDAQLSTQLAAIRKALGVE